MTDITTLRDLKERVENATGPDRELDARIFAALFPDHRTLLDPGSAGPVKRDPEWGPLSSLIDAGWSDWKGVAEIICPDLLTASIDASLALVERKLPGFSVNVYGGDPTLHPNAPDRRPAAELEPHVYDDGAWKIGKARGKGAAIQHAILSAALSALIAKEEAKGMDLAGKGTELKEGAET